MGLAKDNLLLLAVDRRQARIRRSGVRRIPAPSSGWRRNISSKIATGRTPGAALIIGTTSVSNTPANGSGRRRSRRPASAMAGGDPSRSDMPLTR
jgi:hypothetical protein